MYENIQWILSYARPNFCYVQIDLLLKRQVTGLVTQGKSDSNDVMVTSFTVKYSLTGHDWLPYVEYKEKKVTLLHCKFTLSIFTIIRK